MNLLQQHQPTTYSPNDFVFVGKDGKHFGVNRLTKVVARVAKRSGLKHITMHSLRHTVASILANNYNIVLASKALGHSDIKTTMTYYHTDEEKLKQAMCNQEKLSTNRTIPSMVFISTPSQRPSQKRSQNPKTCSKSHSSINP